MVNERTRNGGDKAYKPAKLTIAEFEQFADVINRLVNDSGLKWWIIAAGIGAIFDILHVIWLAARYLLKF